MFTALITTMDKYATDDTVNGVITKESGTIKEFQTVLAIGNNVRDISIGDVVCVDPKRFAVMKHKEGSLKDGVITDNPKIGYNFDVVVIDDKQCLLLQDRDISFVVEEFETVPDVSIPIYTSQV